MSEAAKRTVKYEIEGTVSPGLTRLHLMPKESFKPFRFHLSGDLEELAVTSIKIGVVEQMVRKEGRKPEPVPAEIFARVPHSPVWLSMGACDKSLLFSVEVLNDGDGDAKVKVEIEGDAVGP